MKIANPIYDAVFKFLMQDINIAKDILSVILNVEIIELELQPQEVVLTVLGGLRLLRLDFKARIRLKDGTEKVILIEIQKSKKDSNVARFRRYLGDNYAKIDEVINEFGETQRKSLPITAIYFLGFELENISAPIVKVVREYRNAVTNQLLTQKEAFIEQLSHDLYAIQIPKLKMVARTELERILDVFSEHKYKTNDKKVLEYTSDVTDPRVKRILSRLNMALMDDEIIEAIIAEEEIENDFKDISNQLDKALQAKEEERKAKEEALLENITLKAQLEELKNLIKK
jgi:SOS response regulatory protein OraA/RecX